MMRLPQGLLALTLFSQLSFLPSALSAAQVADAIAPEASISVERKALTVADDFMVVAANPHATKAGYDAIKAGGNAIDAMVAVQVMLGLVEPQSSGLGGGAFTLYYEAKTNKLYTFDGRETAPLAATPELFIEDGQPLKFFDAVVGGRSVGTPGTPKLLGDLHKRFGQLPLAQLLQPSIVKAEEGFLVSPRMAGSIARDGERLKTDVATAAYFFNPDGQPLRSGQLLKNLEYASTLRQLAKSGFDSFYNGELADAIIQKVQQAANPGVLDKEDFKNYQIIQREPVCYLYRGYDVCGMGPPSSGGLTVGQILGMLEHFDLSNYDVTKGDNTQPWHLLGEASRLAFADRGLYMADSDFVSMPNGLLNRQYLAERAKLINPEKAMVDVAAGVPPSDTVLNFAADESIELPSTSHFVIVDKQGNVLSMTTTIENGFGSRLMTNGFLLNNELTDFSFVPEKNGKPVANRLEPGKRPRSSMAPTIVFKDGKPYLAIGSPGGSRIIGYVAKSLVAHLDWGMNIQQAIDLPHAVKRFGTYDLAEDKALDEVAAGLERLGHKVNRRDLNSGLHAIRITDEGLEGAADPRREGQALGE